MSVAANFRRKMDVVLASADGTRGELGEDSRRAALSRDLNEAGLMLVEKEMISALMTAAANAPKGKKNG